MKTEIVPCTEELAHDLAPRLREADVLECMAASGHGPLESLVGSIRASSYCRAMLFDGVCVAMWGVCPVPGDERLGGVWLLGSEELKSHALTFWRLTRPELARCSRLFPILLNFVDARYAAALRWARRLGFEVHPPRPLGPEGLPFHPIVFRR